MPLFYKITFGGWIEQSRWTLKIDVWIKHVFLKLNMKKLLNIQMSVYDFKLLNAITFYCCQLSYIFILSEHYKWWKEIKK